MELSGNMSDVIPTPMTDLLEMEPEKPVYHTDFSSYSGVPKHSKKDYEYLNNMSVQTIFQDAMAEKKKVEYVEAD